MNTLTTGQTAPDFEAVDIFGKPVRLSELRGQPVILSFYRYATCPFCTVRFNQMARELPRLTEAGVRVVAVFESSHDYIHQYLGPRGIPFTVVADPGEQLYRLYGVRKSLFGTLLGMFRVFTMMRAMFDRKYRMGRPDGSLTRIPADFLISANGQIDEAWYGKDIGDHIPMRKVERFGEVQPRPRHTGAAPARRA